MDATIHRYEFKSALPVWEIGENKTMNRTVCFCADVAAGTEVKLAAAASCSFVLLVNGMFVAHGPARCAHGYFRVDEYDLTALMTESVNRIAIRTVGYNVNAFSYIDQPSFLCAELLSNGEVLAATGKSGFTAYRVNERVTKTQRYSFQRTMAEGYNLLPGAFEYELKDNGSASVETEIVPAGTFIGRDMPYSDNEPIQPLNVFARGTVTYSDKPGYYNSREICNIDDKFKGYTPDTLDCASHVEIGRIDYAPSVPVNEPADCVALAQDTYADIDLGRNYTGIYTLELEAEGNGTLFITFDEVMHNNNLNPFRMGTSNIIRFQVEKGTYRIVTAEPYVMKFVRLTAQGCAFTVKNLTVYHIAFPATSIHASYAGDDEVIKQIYDSAVETFRANCVDIYMDCPSRERAGWLCDSFFTSRVEKVLTGHSAVERAFLQNFLLPESFNFLPKGMLPMCYPSDHNDKTYIPNWAMWYGVELGEYLTRTGDRSLIDDAKQRMYDLCAFFKPYENEFGLLERLDSWVFIEWSKSNELVQDVSFASNMLYAKMLDTFGYLYNDMELMAQARKIRQTINDMAMTESGFYCDNANRVNGQLVLSGERTESCQYYAFFCDIATPETHPWLWNTLVHDFGYARAEKGLYPEIWPANAFIGNYLRLDLLDRYGETEALRDNIRGYFRYMAEKTGTLWENVGDYASCNHGFASHVLYWMDHLGMIAHD